MSKAPKNLDDLFHDTLKDVYFAEKKILTTLPKMIKAAQNEDLKAAFEKHRGETVGQVERLEQVFAIIEKKPQGKTCDAILGIVKKARSHRRIQRVAGFGCRSSCRCAVRGTLRNLQVRHVENVGGKLGHADAATLLDETLDQEKHRCRPQRTCRDGHQSDC